ncbi:MAG: xanthine phosphoribosyltransferase [Clostridia bacterium]|nr:xanthine phosphoribosyltransferase [Clostridia bacterium]
MKLLEERIAKDGRIFEGDILKVDNFLNHQIDVDLMVQLSREFYKLFEKDDVNKVLTIEASGIAVACLTAEQFGCPLVFAKKSRTSNMGNNEVYSSPVHSFTHNNDYNAIVSRNYLSPSDRVLIIDDFLAKGSALMALSDIVSQSGATVVGAGILIEKVYQGGGDLIRSRGIRVESLARIASMDPVKGFVFE